MISFLADENFSADIVEGVQRRNNQVSLLTVQEAGLASADDPTVLEWAARRGFLILTHDVNTLPGFAFQRVRAGFPMPGVFEVPQHHPPGPIIDDILLIAECSRPGEWEGQVIYLPF